MPDVGGNGGMIDLTGRVAIVTGAGGGLGREHALLLAERGARVVVNDVGEAAAAAVADEIEARGGTATAFAASVTDFDAVKAMVEATLARWNKVDILINNAGILRDKTFAKMDLADFRLVVEVHLMGSVNCTKAVWDHMRAQNYGRIVMTTSSSGLYGNFGQSNYGAAKLGIIGFMNTIKLEGQKNNIHINAISPVAATRMTENLMPPAVLEKLKPEYVTPGVVYLASEEAPTGAILTAGAGAFALSRIYETEGVYLGEGGLSVEEVRDNWAKITDPNGQQAYQAGGEQSAKFFRKMQGG